MVGADLVHVDVVEAGVDVLLDRGAVALGIRAADDQLGDLVAAHHLCRLLEVARERQLLAERSSQTCVRPDLVRRRDRLVLVRGPADGQLRKPRLAGAACAVEGRDELALGAVATSPSPISPASSAAFGPLAATMISGGSSGSV